LNLIGVDIFGIPGTKLWLLQFIFQHLHILSSSGGATYKVEFSSFPIFAVNQLYHYHPQIGWETMDIIPRP